jgi:VIT1/CCC1 family predicted Fe2+/Mn2+ transporter
MYVEAIHYSTTMVLAAVGDTASVAPNSIGGAQYLSALIGVVLPILVALVTKNAHSATLKSVLLLILSAVSGFLTELQTSGNFVWQQALFGAVMTFVVGVATLFGLWKPTGVDAKAKSTLVKD